MRPGNSGHVCFSNYLKFVLQKKYVFIICVLSAIKVFLKTTLKINFGDPTLVTPLEPPMHYIFAARYISCKKTSAIRKSKKWINNPWFMRGGDLCKSQTPRV